MYYAGIDPGGTGALALLDEKGGFVEVIDFGEAFPRIKLLAKEIKFLYLEQVSSMPKNGGKSMFTFGKNYGWWQGTLYAYGVPFRLIRPQEWQKGLLPKKKSKTDKPGLIVARHMFPMAPLNLQKHHNRADALLIAKVCHQREGV